MTFQRKIIKRLRNNEQGAVLIEFAFVAPIFFLILMGVFDLGYTIYARAVMNGALQTAARDSSLETSAGTSVVIVNGTPTQVQNTQAVDDALVKRIEDVVPFGTVTPTRRSYFDFFDVERPEEFSDSGSMDGICNDNEAYTDENNNGVWDDDVGSDGIGGPRDVVLYEINLTYRRIFPLHSFIGTSPTQVITASTVLRNQPYGQQLNNSATTQSTCP